MARQGKQKFRWVIGSVVLPFTLAGCLMNDPSGSSDPASDGPTRENNAAPEISGSPPRTIRVGVNYSFAPEAADPDADTLSFSIKNKPVWISFDSKNGSISGIPQLGHEGMHGSIEITASDGLMSTTLPDFSIDVISVTAPNMPPEIAGEPAQEVTAGGMYLFTPAGSDPDGNTLAFSVENLPGWAVFSTLTGRLSGTPGSGDEGTYADIAISVTDGLNAASLPAFSITVGAAAAAPTISGSPVSSVVAGSPYSFVPTAFDPNGDAMTFSVQNLPGWADFSPSTGALTGTPQMGDAGTHGGIVISVSDGSLSSALPAFSVDVVQSNSAPQIDGTPALSVNVGQNYSFTPTASDPDGNTLVFDIQNRPAWAQFDVLTGTLSGSPQVGDSGTYANVSISVSDGMASTDLPGFAITVNQVSLGSATVSWTPPIKNTDGSDLTDLSGFRVYYGMSAGSYPNQIAIDNPGVTTYVVENLTPGTWHFVSTSVNSAGMESEVSNVATKTIN